VRSRDQLPGFAKTNRETHACDLRKETSEYEDGKLAVSEEGEKRKPKEKGGRREST